MQLLVWFCVKKKNKKNKPKQVKLILMNKILIYFYYQIR